MIYHVVNTYKTRNSAELGRLKRAFASWQMLEMRSGGAYRLVMRESFGRSSRDVGDKREVAFVKDVIESIADEAVGSDIVMLTNADSGLVTDTAGIVEYQMGGRGIVWSSRLDVDKPLKLGDTGIDSARLRELICTSPHKGLDMVAMTWDWWLAHRDEYPDMLLGYEAWDAVMILLAGEENKLTSPVVYHEIHDGAYWYNNRFRAAGNLWNRRLAKEWLLSRDLYRRACIMWPGMKQY